MKASLLLAMLIPLAWGAPEAADDLDLDLDERCDKECPGVEKPVCANDGKMYQEHCRFLIAQCKAKYRGKKLELASCENQLSDDQKRLVEMAFARFTKKGWRITLRKLKWGLLRYFNKRMNRRELKGLFRRADADGNRKIDLPEFLDAVAKMMRNTEKNVMFWFGLFNRNGDKVIDANERTKASEVVGQVAQVVPYGGVLDDDKKLTYSEFAKVFGG